MEITKTNETVTVNATTSNGEIDYVFNYGLQGSKLMNLGGQIKKKGAYIGSFTITETIENESNTNVNFNYASIVADRQAAIVDIDAIHKNVLESLNV